MGDDAKALNVDVMLAFVSEYLARGGTYGNEKGGAWRLVLTEGIGGGKMATSVDESGRRRSKW